MVGAGCKDFMAGMTGSNDGAFKLRGVKNGIVDGGCCDDGVLVPLDGGNEGFLKFECNKSLDSSCCFG